MDHVALTERAGYPLFPNKIDGKLTPEEIKPVLVRIVYFISSNQEDIDETIKTPLQILGTGKQTRQAVKMPPNLVGFPIFRIAFEDQRIVVVVWLFAVCSG